MNTILCHGCNVELPTSEFWKHKTKGFQSLCKACSTKRRRNYYLQNKVRETERRLSREQDLKEWFRDLKSQPCSDCGQSFHFSAMDWDHLSNKTVNVSDLIRKGFGKKRILQEIEKCDLVCANCHRIRSYERSVRSSVRTLACHAKKTGSIPVQTVCE